MASGDQPISVRRFDNSEVYSAKVNSKTTLMKTISVIKEKLNPTQLKKFEDSCFGHFLEVSELQFSGHTVNHMLFRQCVCDDYSVMEFNFGGLGARFTQQEFGLITGLRCGPRPIRRVASSMHIKDTYFGGRRKVFNSDIWEVFGTAQCRDDDPDDNDRLKLALLLFLETVIFSKEKSTSVNHEHLEMIDDLDYFQSYPWGITSYIITIRSLRAAFYHRGSMPSNPSHTYSLIGFPLAFMIWGYEIIPLLAATYGKKCERIRTPRILNWEINISPSFKKLKDIFFGRDYEVIGVLEPTEAERDFVRSIVWGARRPHYDRAPIVGDKPPGNNVAEKDEAAVRPHKTGDREKKRKQNEVAGDAGKRRARHAEVPASAAQLSSSCTLSVEHQPPFRTPPVVNCPDYSTPAANHQASSTSHHDDRDDDDTPIARRSSSSTAPHVTNEGSSVKSRFSRIEGDMDGLRGQMTRLESKVDLIISLLLARPRSGVQVYDDSQSLEDDDSQRPKDGLGGLDDGTTSVGAGVGTSGMGDGAINVDFEGAHSLTPTEDIQGNVTTPTDGQLVECPVSLQSSPPILIDLVDDTKTSVEMLIRLSQSKNGLVRRARRC